ncbi:MAG: hypothetical protein QOC59_425 [Microbacteriaceae bacterium]|nr:hypothetical protein [Microbacteriaceae bacterium]
MARSGWGRVARRIGTAVALVAAVALSGCAAGVSTAPKRTAAAASFQNPIKAAGADPFVVQWQGSYLLIESRDGGIWITRSPKNDLTDFDGGKQVRIWDYPADGPSCADVWAPELHRIGDRWYVYFAATTCDKNNDNHRMFALESTSADPLGGYVEKGEVADEANRWAIDGTQFSWHGSRYFVWSGWPGRKNGQQNLYIAKMSGPTKLVGTGVLLSEPTEAFERIGMPINEGPEALVHGGVLRIVYSASGSWTDDYCLGMLTLHGADPLDRGSWSKSPKAVVASTDAVFAPGHGSFVKSPDGRQDWLVYHSARYSGAGWDRMINAQRFTWRSDGSPDFGRPVADTRQALPSGQKSAG